MKSSLTICLLLAACVAAPMDGEHDEPSEPTDPGDSPPPPPPPPPLTLADRYDVVSTWDLSSMVDDQALGAAARQRVVELAVDLLGVPSFVRDEAIDEVDGLIGPEIEAEVTALAAGSETLDELRADLGEAEIASEWTLDGGAGRERLIAMAVETNGVAFSASLDTLDPIAEIGGPLAITGDGATRTVETYELAFGAGALIRPAAEAAVAAALEPLSCDAIAALVVGADGELVIDVRFVDYTITAADVSAGCADQIDNLAAEVLGFIDLEIGVELGGPIALIDADGDRVAERIASAGGYAGALLGLPLPIAVAVDGVAR